MAFLSGLSAFPITPADRSGQIDVPALRRMIARLTAAKVDSIGLLGSTGIYMYLSRDERRRALEETLMEANGEVPVVVGVGALRTDEAVKLAQDARAMGAAAGLLAAVSYTPLTEEEVFQHFSTVASESGLPIVIYDNPGTTHFHFTPGLAARLSQAPGIVAIKNPTDKKEVLERHLTEQRKAVPPDFSIGYSGDWNAAEAMIAGADTWYSVLGGILPGVCMKIVRAAQRGDAAEARRIDSALEPLWDCLKHYSSLRVVYVLAEYLGVCSADPPLPIQSISKMEKQKVIEALEVTLERVEAMHPSLSQR